MTEFINWPDPASSKSFKISLNEVQEVETKPPFGRRHFRNLFGPISKEVKANVFVERFEPGAESFPHYHSPPQVEIFYGLKGTGVCELVSTDQTFSQRYKIEPGDCVYCPENWTHKIKNASDKEEWMVLGIAFNTQPTTG